MKKYINGFALSVFSLVFPVVSFAALDGLKGLIRDAKEILDLIIPVVFVLALVYFFWGVAQFILNDAGSEKTREEGKKKMIWGVIALFVMFSIMGIISIISGLTGIPTTVRSSGTSNSTFDTSQSPF